MPATSCRSSPAPRRRSISHAIAAALIGASALSACTTTPPPAAAPIAPLADDSDTAINNAIKAITTFPTKLDPRIWDGMAMKPDVHDAIERVVDRVTRASGIDGLTIDGVGLFGSNASYEYDDKSDVGVHVFVHKPGMTDEDLEPFMQLLNDQIERRQEGQILLYGLPLEVVFHAGRPASHQPQAGIGQYSVTDNRWVVEPVQQPDNFDINQMRSDAKTYIGKYNSVVGEYLAAKKGFDCSRFNKLDDEMGAYRNSGFEQGLGSRSTQNLTYRALRRLNVEIPEMVDTLEDECTFVNESIG